ncbi:type II/IV secretion system ATPase subunit [Halobaculum sp. P14]|uniref:type II/IV secretion system ATPase subunit n=1 Tax=Halobaculum sp. P14 TaxID=3421638 RepID=UPI003EBDE92C
MSEDAAGDADTDALRSAVLDDAAASLRASSPLGRPDESYLRESLFEFAWPESFDLVDDYWVREPFAHVALFGDPESGEQRYVVTEPALDEFESHVRKDVADRVRTRLLDDEYGSAEQGRERFREDFESLLAEEARHVDPGVRHVVAYYLRRDFLGYGEIDPFMQDPHVEDLHVDGADVPAFVYHDRHGNLETNRSWGDDRLDEMTVRLAQRTGRHLSASRPLLTSTLPDGSRIQVTLGTDVATRGSNFTVRKFREEPFTPPELARLGTYTVEELAYLWLAIEHNRSVLFVGPTASGKTTSMNACSLFVPPDAKVVSIEETREIGLPHDNWISNVTRESDVGDGRPEVGMYGLLSEALHQRPTHILVGELRTDPEVVYTFFQAVGTGHAGFSTFHADTADDALRRLRNDPLSIPDELAAEIDVVAVQHLMEVDGDRVRKNRSLTEVHPADDPDESRPELRSVFAYDPTADETSQRSASRLLAEVAREQGWTDAELRTKLERRRRLLGHLVGSDTTGYEAVTNRLFRFARRPDAVLDELDEEPIPETRPVRVQDV